MHNDIQPVQRRHRLQLHHNSTHHTCQMATNITHSHRSARNHHPLYPPFQHLNASWKRHFQKLDPIRWLFCPPMAATGWTAPITSAPLTREVIQCYQRMHGKVDLKRMTRPSATEDFLCHANIQIWLVMMINWVRCCCLSSQKMWPTKSTFVSCFDYVLAPCTR